MFGKFRHFIRRLRSSYTHEEVEKAEYIFYLEYLQKGMVVFDVGSNIGELSMIFSKFVGSTGIVHAFEACQGTFEQSSGILNLAGKKNIILNHVALSDKNENIKLYIYGPEYSGWNTIADRPLKNYGIDKTPVAEEYVEAITIDTYCENNGIRQIDLLKIDVEGAEYQVLKGARKMLANKQIKCIIFEYGQTTFDMGNRPADITNFLDSHGYKILNVIKGSANFPGGNDVSKAMFSMHIAKP
jgi:FkbM family methyltransferase